MEAAEASDDRRSERAKLQHMRAGFEGHFGRHLVSPRTLSADLLTKLVAVEGIVTKVSITRPKMVRSVSYCPATGDFHRREYRDASELRGAPTATVYPTKDDKNNVLEMEFGMSTYRDHQVFTLQEMPERAPLGQLPRSIDVFVQDDLVDRVKPGDRCVVFGIYRPLAGAAKGSTTGHFRCVVLGSNVLQLTGDAAAAPITPDDIKNIRKFARKSDAFDQLARSLAPSIFGHEAIKRSLALMLVGGAEKNLDNGTHIRGDVNILMVGDPSTAKSQLLRYVMNIAPLAVSTTGRGSSGVGLTAAVTQDRDTGDRRLEAGAMVLADRGVVCIDEFDKMSDADRVAIHEVMEQQTVTIAKAGIQAQLNARCSVVAAANPVYGAYDISISPQANVNLPDSLLSRFDLLFIVLDNLSVQHDSMIAQHILSIHRYQRPGYEGVPQPLHRAGHEYEQEDDEEAADGRGTAQHEEGKTAPVMQPFNALLHAGISASLTGQKRKRGAAAAAPAELFHPEFIKKWIQFAKRLSPTLSDAAREAIASRYNDIRQKTDTLRSMPITARALETLIRLSTAHTKLRLGRTVEVGDVKAAFEVLSYALYDVKMTRADKAAGKSAGDVSAEEGDEWDEGDDSATDDEGEPAEKPAGRARRVRAGASAPVLQSDEEESEEDTKPTGKGAAAAAAAAAPAAVDTASAEYKAFTAWLNKHMRNMDAATVTALADAAVAAGKAADAALARAYLEKLNELNRGFIVDDIFHKL